MCCARGVTLLMCSAAAHSISSARPARVRASDAQPEMARFGMPECFGVQQEMLMGDFDMNCHVGKMWENFWIEVMMHVPRQNQESVGVGSTHVSERLMRKYKMLLIRTGAWAMPRRSRFRSCPDLPRFSQFELCGGHLRRSASDGCLEVRRTASLWHLVDLWSPVVPDGDEELEEHTKWLMEVMIITMPDAYHRALARGLIDPLQVPAACVNLRLFVDLANVAAEAIGLPWAVTFRASEAGGCRMDILITSRNLAALSHAYHFPFSAFPP